LNGSQRDTLHLIENIFQKNGVNLVSLSESLDRGTAFGKASVGILSAFSQLEREVFSERSRLGKTERAKARLYKGGLAPFGYLYVEENLR